jgi:hypothetical protein
MHFFSVITDSYDRGARLLPALLLVVPIIAVMPALYLQTIPPIIQSLFPLVILSALAFLITNLIRDMGKKKEATLFDKWGGKPSVAVFRYSNNRIDIVTKERYHKKLSMMCQTSFVSTEDERNDKEKADLIYASWSRYLKSRTRDKKIFYLLFKEAIAYGFRRNTYGVRYIGIIICLFCLLANIAWFIYSYKNNEYFSIFQYFSTGISILFFFLWCFIITDNWVRVIADRHADQLAKTVDMIDEKST